MAGTAGIQNPLHVMYSGLQGPAANDYTLTRSGVIVDAWCVARANQAGGTFQFIRVRNSAADPITDAMSAAVDQVVSRAGTINDAFYQVVAGDGVRFQTVGVGTWVDAVAVLIPPPANFVPVG